VTSVGAWEPVVVQAGSAGQAGGGAGGLAGGTGAGGQIEPRAPGLYLEAERGLLSGGFAIASDPQASNGQYIEGPTGPVYDMAPGGPAQAHYSFELDSDGDYVIWGRIYSPSISSNRFWFQVDGGDWHLWRITVGVIWYWDDFHDNQRYNDTFHFPLTAGPHQLIIANAVNGAKLDRLYITADGDEPPGNDTPCRPPHSIDMGGGICSPSCGSQATVGMGTSCDTTVCMDNPDQRDAYDCGVCCLVP
jgi:hypothetical protein